MKRMKMAVRRILVEHLSDSSPVIMNQKQSEGQATTAS